ncbi:MAG: type II secretion system protein [Thermoguttaceae bacterium]
MNIGSVANLPIAVTAVVAWLSSLVYVVVRFRRGRRRFSLFDALVMVLLMATVSAAAMPLVVAAVHRTRDSAVLASLHMLRSQIALYKLEHNGEPPILYHDTLPQLLQATNADGVPGLPGSDRPYGPYFHKSLPTNPATGRSTVTPIKVFPPTAASGNGGWLFHPDSGQIAIDLPEMLNR